MVANFERRSTDILVDFDHASVFDGDTRAAAWISDVEVRDDGLYGRISDWTSAGEDAFANRDFRYISPVYFLESEDKQGEAAGAYVHSVAITNLPYFDEGEVDAIGNRAGDPSDDDAPDDPSPQDDPDPMNERQKLARNLGLDDDASWDDIHAEIDRRESEDGEDDDSEGDEEAPDASGDDSGDGEEPGADAPEEEAGEESEDEELTEAKVNSILDERLAERDGETKAQALVSAAIEAEKILPAQREIYLNSARADYEATKEQLGNMDPGSASPERVTTGSGGAKASASSLKPGTQELLEERGV
jgi:phage I-like protein